MGGRATRGGAGDRGCRVNFAPLPSRLKHSFLSFSFTEYVFFMLLLIDIVIKVQINWGFHCFLLAVKVSLVKFVYAWCV